MRKPTAKSPETACRKCNLPVPTGAKACPNCGMARKSDAVSAVFVVLLLASSLLLVSSSYVTSKQADAVKSTSSTTISSVKTAPPELPPQDQSQGAYTAAKRLIEQQFPNAKRISEFRESPVTKSGTTFQVTLFVDSVENGTAVRNALQVKLDFTSGNWKLKEIVR
jgi:RNA polymerase subunit RPABC4/transcription elongation factor Spt4